jgi:hypothetical protein
MVEITLSVASNVAEDGIRRSTENRVKWTRALNRFAIGRLFLALR